MVTRDKEVEESPFQSEERFRTLLKEAPLSIYEIDFDGSKFRYVNSRFAQILGYSEEELLAKDPLDLLSDESKRKFQDLIREVIAENKTDFSDEFEAIGKNGQSVWGVARAKVNFKDGKPDSLLVFAQDITERKKTEEALRLSEEKFSKAFQNAPFAVTLTCLSDGTIVDANDSALALFGYNREEIIGKRTLAAGIWVNPEDRAEFVKELSLKGSVHYKELNVAQKKWKHLLCELVSLKHRNSRRKTLSYLHLLILLNARKLKKQSSSVNFVSALYMRILLMLYY